MFIFDDLIIGSLKGYLQRKAVDKAFLSAKKSAFKHLNNSLNIWIGLFTGTLRQVISRLSWEILQTIIGFFAAHFANLIRNVDCVEFAEGTTVLCGGGWRGSISFGSHILLYPGYKAGAGKMLFMHEFGHTLQSRKSGPLYLFKYGIPSILTDNYSWMEQDANLRAALYFEKYHNIPVREWQITRFSKMAQKPINPKIWEYLLLFILIGLIVIPLLNYKKGK